MVNRHDLTCLTLLCCSLASLAGCSLLQSGESQLFSSPSRYQAASITYRKASCGTDEVPGRRTTLAIRYPHPAGRAGCARVELIVDGGFGTRDPLSPRWLDRMRRLARENLPGVSLAPGIEEALGYDWPVAELDPLLARLEHPLPTSLDLSPGAKVSVVASINGAAVPPRNAPLAELEELIARVRREGSLISHGTPAPEFPPEASQPLAPPPVSQVVTVGYSQAVIERLPPVSPTAR